MESMIGLFCGLVIVCLMGSYKIHNLEKAYSALANSLALLAVHAAQLQRALEEIEHSEQDRVKWQ
jgi:hypothetical protein